MVQPPTAPPSASSTSLDPLETTVDRHGRTRPRELQEPPNSDASFRHSSWAPDRSRVWRALIQTGASADVLDRFEACGSAAWVMRTDEAQPRYAVSCNRCRNRWCLACQRERATKVRAGLREHLPQTGLRLVTLTLRSDDEPLADLLDRLIACGRRLRQSQIWRRCVRGAAQVVEITRGRNGTRWHVHAHLICVGSYLPHAALKDAWHRATGDSYIVDVRRLRDSERAVAYVAKYLTKGVDQQVYRDPDLLQEAMTALKGRRQVQLLGDLRGVSLLEGQDAPDWQPVCKLDVVLRNAREGAAWALEILKALGRTEDHDPDPLAEPP